MDKMNLFTLIAVSFPEVVIILMLGFTLVGIKVSIRKIILIAFLQTCFSFIIRTLPVGFGLHSLIQVAFFMVLIHLVTRIPYRGVITSMLLSLSIYLVIEASSLSFINKTLDVSLNNALVDPVERIIYFIPQFLIMSAILIILKLKKFRLVNLPESSWEHE